MKKIIFLAIFIATPALAYGAFWVLQKPDVRNVATIEQSTHLVAVASSTPEAATTTETQPPIKKAIVAVPQVKNTIRTKVAVEPKVVPTVQTTITTPSPVTPVVVQQTPTVQQTQIIQAIDPPQKDNNEEQIKELEQQIIDLKQNYYTQVSAIQKEVIPVEFQNGRIAKLTDDDNVKIAQLDLQIQQLELNN